MKLDAKPHRQRFIRPNPRSQVLLKKERQLLFPAPRLRPLSCGPSDSRKSPLEMKPLRSWHIHVHEMLKTVIRSD